MWRGNVLCCDRMERGASIKLLASVWSGRLHAVTGGVLGNIHELLVHLKTRVAIFGMEILLIHDYVYYQFFFLNKFCWYNSFHSPDTSLIWRHSAANRTRLVPGSCKSSGVSYTILTALYCGFEEYMKTVKKELDIKLLFFQIPSPTRYINNRVQPMGQARTLPEAEPFPSSCGTIHFDHKPQIQRPSQGTVLGGIRALWSVWPDDLNHSIDLMKKQNLMMA